MALETWAIAGVLLILLEFAAPGLILAFFGMAALTVALGMAVGVIGGTSSQWSVFGVASVVYLVALRGVFKRWLRGRAVDAADGSGIVDELEGQRVDVVADFVSGRGKVLLNGVKWDAESADELKAGDTAIILGKQGIRLQVGRPV